MAKARGLGNLGKGLDALMGGSALQEAGAVFLPITQVEPGLNQPRKRFDEGTLAELAASIQEHGVLQPLTVRRMSTGYYQIIAGERRWRAAREAGLREVPVVVVEADDRKVLELGLIENLQREDLNPMEEAEGYYSLIHEYGMTQDDVAQQMGKSRSAVSNALRLTALPAPVRELLVNGALTAGHARAVLMVEGEENQVAFAKMVVSQGLNVRQAETAAKRFARAVAEPKEKQDDPNCIYVQAVEKDLSRRLGRKVSISGGGRKGKLALQYYSVDDLNELLDMLELLEQLPAARQKAKKE